MIKNYKTYFKSLPIELQECDHIYLHTKRDNKTFLLENISSYWGSLETKEKGYRVPGEIIDTTDSKVIIKFSGIKPSESTVTVFDTIIYCTPDGEVSGYTTFGGLLQDISSYQEFTIIFTNNIKDLQVNPEVSFSYYLDENQVKDNNDISPTDPVARNNYIPKSKVLSGNTLSGEFDRIDSYVRYTDNLCDLMADPSYSIITDSNTIVSDKDAGITGYSLTLGSKIKYGLLDYNKITIIDGKIVLYSINTKTGDYAVTSFDDINHFGRPRYKYFSGIIPAEYLSLGIKMVASRYIIFETNQCYNIETGRLVSNPGFYKYLNPWETELSSGYSEKDLPIDVSGYELSRRIGVWGVYESGNSRSGKYEYYVSLSGCVKINTSLEKAYPLNDRGIMVESLEKIYGYPEPKRILSFYFPQNGETISSLGCYPREYFTSLTPSYPGYIGNPIYVYSGVKESGPSFISKYYDTFKIISAYNFRSSIFKGIKHKSDYEADVIPGFNETDLFWENTTDYSGGRIIDTFRGYIFYIDNEYLYII